MKRVIKKNGNSLEDKERRKEWLLDNRILWSGIDPFNPKSHVDQITTVAEKMKEAGLYSDKTFIGDARMGLVKLLKVIKQNENNRF